MKSRKATSSDPVSCGARILRDCHQTYTDPDQGLIAIAQSVGMTLLPPSKKITVMLMGNDSAGKSSFINWYIAEHILNTGAADDAQGFTFVTSGNKRESLKGNTTFQLYPHLKALQEVKGVSGYVGTEICTSQQKCFSLVNFVDTPGLVDGDMKYPFDVDQAILRLGDVSDLILVFFDPMGKTLCEHTLNIIEKLNKRRGDRLRFYLSKADQVGGESDRQRVMMQIVHELCKRLGLNECGPDMPAIYIPNPNKPSRCVNKIEEVCHTIQKAISQTLQSTLNTLEKDCEVICEAVTDALNSDWQSYENSWGANNLSPVFGFLGFIVLLFSSLMLGIFNPEVMDMALGSYATERLLYYSVPLLETLDPVPVQIQFIFCGVFIQLSVIFLTLAVLLFNTKPILSAKQKIQLQEKLEYMHEVVKTKKMKLYDEYLQWIVGDQNMN